jgi:hypothetical protein
MPSILNSSERAKIDMDGINSLIQALKEQTAAINRLVESNATLMALMLDEPDDDELPRTMLDGSPCP